MLFFTKDELKRRISSIKHMIEALNAKKNYFEKLLQGLECSADKQCLIVDMSIQGDLMDYFVDCDTIELTRDHSMSAIEKDASDPKVMHIIKEKNDVFLTHITDPNIRKELSRCTELITPKHVNKLNKITNDMLTKTVNELEVWDVMMKKDVYSDHEVRMLMTELDIHSRVKVDNLCTIIKSKELKDYLMESMDNGNLNLLQVKEAISEQVSVEEAIKVLKRSCGMCTLTFPIPEMCKIVTCGHEFCKDCIFGYFKEAITNRYPSHWYCPCCTGDQCLHIDKKKYYSQLRNILSKDKILLNIFEKKLDQEKRNKGQYLRVYWCANEKCTSKFEAEGKNKIQCPLCFSYMCANCKRDWHPQHENRTCHQFELWMLKNNTDLTNLLKFIGIECPGCGVRYALAAGGSLNFQCKMCGIHFCGGCYQLFVEKCNKPNCIFKGFHGHHPRNCWYFLRDKTANELEEMLRGADYPKLQGKPELNCPFMITDYNFNDIPCAKDVYNTSGLCEGHYSEYLIQFINHYEIDPADFADSFSLNLMLFQMVLPKSTKANKESEAEFTERLKKMVKKNCSFYRPKSITENRRASFFENL